MKIADITPGLYVYQPRKGPTQTMLVLSGGLLYSSLAGPSYPAQDTTSKVYRAHGMGGVLCAYVPLYRGRLRNDLSDSPYLPRLIEQTDRLRDLATTVSLERASQVANEIIGLGWDAVRVASDVNPHTLKPAPPSLLERNPDIRLRNVLAGLRARNLDASWHQDGIHLRLSIDESEQLLGQLE